MQSRTLLASVFIGAAALLVSAVLIVRTIQSEAERTRQAMSDAADSNVSSEAKHAIKAGREGGEDIAAELGDTAQTIFGEFREILGDTTRSPQPVLPSSSDNQPVTPPTSDSNTTGSQPLDPTALIGGLFKTGRETTRTIDRSIQESIQLDASEENELGQQLHEILMTQQPMLLDPKYASQLADLAEPFLRQRNRKTISYTFSVVDDPSVNAFAHVGGYVYVNRGLLEFVENEGELAFVLGHEIAHVDLSHCAEKMTYAARASELAGDLGASLVQLGYQTIAAGYAEDREFEADARSYSLMGKDKPSAITFLTRLANLEPSQSEETSNEVIDVTLREIDGHFATHPATHARITALRNVK